MSAASVPRKEVRSTFRAGAETLVGYSLPGGLRPPSQVLFLHGAGEATQERARLLAEGLSLRGVGSLRFDFSGHGESSGSLQLSSLEKRTSEAEAALRRLKASTPITVCAFSMGGHVALELLRRHPIRNLILFYPAIYDEAAYRLRFGPEFSSVVRRPGSWREATVLRLLEDFRGGLLVVIGDRDEVIPRGVIDLLDAHSPRAHHKEIFTVPGGGHHLLPHIYGDEALLERTLQKMVGFCS